MDFTRRFSIAHPERGLENGYPNHYYLVIKNTPKTILNEIEDIYFGKNFYYKYQRRMKFVGNAMGSEATDEQTENLLRIQEEFGVCVSLTMNSTTYPDELLLDQTLQDDFVEWIGKYYDKGLRSCTIGNMHIMRTGKLQRRCPDMHWKNTVNHLISDGQQVADTIGCGFNTILLDRSLNRNIKELKRIYKFLSESHPDIQTSLLLSESCLYRCPFKLEHDTVGGTISSNYWGEGNALSTLSCNHWKSDERDKLPRNGINMVVSTKEFLDEYLNTVNILKSSGRFDGNRYNIYTEDDIKSKNIKLLRSNAMGDDDFTLYSSSFEKCYNLNTIPFDRWLIVQPTDKDDNLTEDNFKEYSEDFLQDEFWLSDTGQRLNKILLNCRSQCYNCHECERAFGIPDYDSSVITKDIKI